MEKPSENLKIVRDDIMRYKKNKLGQWLCYGGLAFGCLYIMLLYAYNNSTFYTVLMGASVLYTLVLLLASFLCAEGVKVYNKRYCIVLLILAVVEFARIFIYPNIAWRDQAFWITLNKTQVGKDYFGAILSQPAARSILIVYLVLSTLFYIAAAVYSYFVCVRHEAFEKRIAEGTVDVELALKGLEEEELAAAAAQESAAPAAEEVQ